MEEYPLIQKIRTLPTPSPVMRRISAVVSSPDSSMTDVVEAIKFDPAIAGKILRLANSAYIGMQKKVSSLQNAVVLLGLKKVHSMVLVSQFAEPLKKTGAFSFPLERFWRHSTTLALIAESIGRHLRRYESVDEQEIFSAAILHDIGKLVLAVHEPGILDRAELRARQQRVPFYKAEEEPYAHTAIGALLADQWGFPPELSVAISNHHAPAASSRHFRFVAIIHVADVMVHLIGSQTFENETPPELDEAALAAAQLQPERLRIIAETELENQARLEELCGIMIS